MIVYADRQESVGTKELQGRIETASDPLEQLILRGQWEAGVADAQCPEIDDLLRLDGPLPDRITIRKPEGYAFYSVFPEMYAQAARTFVREQQPNRCVVIGIRSIGASLSMAVAAAVNACLRFTVRPRGHPFDRELRLSPALEQLIQVHRHDWFLIVDEGPGISGSSFMSVVAKLEELGAAPNQIVLFPSHQPDPDTLLSPRARESWGNYRCYVEPFRHDRFVPPAARDISGGRWRLLSYESQDNYPAVQPQHERRKYLHSDRLWKFAGLAQFGRARFERAQRLTAFCPHPERFENGFLVSEWVRGRPATLTENLLDAMARYLAFLRSEFATDQPIPGAELELMIEVNTGERIGAPVTGVVTALDGRMMPHEWLETERGYVKTDALDHHDDHFFPGCQDIAWDIAGAAIEWGFEAESLVQRYLRLQEDPSLRKRLPFYEKAYRAYRYGYCSMAADALGDAPDGQRFRRLSQVYQAFAIR